MRESRVRSAPTVLAGIALAAACGAPAGDDFADRMAREHAGDAPVPGEAARTAPAGEVETSTVEYATVGGAPVAGFLARPKGDAPTAAGVIVIQEWWGLNDNIRAMARRLAGEGYVALAVDLYRGQVAEDPGRARELMQAAMQREPELEENLRQAARYLGERIGTPRVGVIGWCFGGGWSLRTALMLPGEIDAAVIYYGRPVTERERLAALDAPLLGIFGAEDQGIPVEQVRELERVLLELGKQVEIRIYEGAGHAFANPSGTRYQAEAATDAWGRTVAFLRRHLRPE